MPDNDHPRPPLTFREALQHDTTLRMQIVRATNAAIATRKQNMLNSQNPDKQVDSVDLSQCNRIANIWSGDIIGGDLLLGSAVRPHHEITDRFQFKSLKPGSVVECMVIEVDGYNDGYVVLLKHDPRNQATPDLHTVRALDAGEITIRTDPADAMGTKITIVPLNGATPWEPQI